MEVVLRFDAALGLRGVERVGVGGAGCGRVVHVINSQSIPDGCSEDCAARRAI
ncbi:MAG TPA: hypothetical protein VFA44_09100 [Gaiellaceae bacterium]|jgi:hypothetical protein|nr:hypothetical protein [Gaiellaceae bacterium]